MKKLINFDTHSHAAPAQLVGPISFEIECEHLAKNGYRVASSNTVQGRIHGIFLGETKPIWRA